MKTLSNSISKFEKYLSVVLMFAMAVIVVLSVGFRYVINAPLSWAGEVSIFLLIWTSFIGGSLGLKFKSQAAVTIVLDYLPSKAQKITNIIGHLLMILFLIVLLYYSYTWIFSDSVSFQKSTSLRLPMWIPFAAVPLGLTFAAIHLSSNLVDLFRKEEVE